MRAMSPATVIMLILCGCVSSVLAQTPPPSPQPQPGSPTQPTGAPERPRLAVVDFQVKGDVGIPGAGEVVAELLVTRLSPERFRLVERSQLTAILKEIDTTIANVRDNPEAVYGKIRGVKYIVLGSVNKLGKIILTARRVDLATGDIVQQAEASAVDADSIPAAIDELARVLAMTDDEKRAYLVASKAGSPGAAAPVTPAAAVPTALPAKAGAAGDVELRILTEELKLTEEQQAKLAVIFQDEKASQITSEAERQVATDAWKDRLAKAQAAGDKAAAQEAVAAMDKLRAADIGMRGREARRLAVLTGEQKANYIAVSMLASIIQSQKSPPSDEQRARIRELCHKLSGKLRFIETDGDVQDRLTIMGEIEQQAGLSQVPKAAVPAAPSPAQPGEASVIPAVNSRDAVVYVVDRSGSMVDCFDAVRLQVNRSIAALGQGNTFVVLMMGDGQPIEPAGRKMMPATDQMKKAIAGRLSEVHAQGKTNAFAAIERAFDIIDQSGGAGVIHLITDGALPDEKTTLELIRARTAKAKVMINVVLAGEWPAGADAPKMMQSIAKQNGGAFVLMK